ncbi:MAG: TRAP transporter large permease subunit [Reyranella sp.]|uniref:TRAP transporter large permease subunit n=1 Tax=Reyranella sp. TaxID=1929291 RepID=UPI001ACF19CC|nr:TRAP transporter large permease subunit [Reyranella sp.]MBN9087697.1 TRAP transporter large permease subunit [Reyranella sp.]
MATAGLWMLLAVAIVLLATGLPAFAVLMGVSVAFAAIGVLAGGLEYGLLTALPTRIVGLLETDLLQALPLYVFMGALLNRLPLADRLFRCGVALGGKSGGAPAMATLGLGALLAPMNGSVGASVAMLSRSVAPKLTARGTPVPESTALVCVASTLGVVIPPSLVLILLGDAMMRAHTEAANVTGATVRIVNTQDIFRGALVPAALFLVLCLLVAWALGRRHPARSAAEKPEALEWLTGLVAALFVIGLLTGVAAGYFYAVEAAAMGGTALLLFGWLSGGLKGGAFGAVLRDTMAVSGALFALFIAATTFTLVFRAFGTDRLLDAWVKLVPFGATGAAIAVLALLALQASFLVPPTGYAVMMARSAMKQKTATRPLARALAPYLAAQLVVLALVVALPGTAHFAQPKGHDASPVETKLDDDAARQKFNDMLNIPAPED